MSSMFNSVNFNSALKTISQHADKYAKEASVMASKYGKEGIKKLNAAMGKEQIVSIGNRQMRVLEQLAEGGYAYVYKAEDVTTGQVFALKRMLIQDEDTVHLADAEIEIMKKLANKSFVIQFLGSTKRRIEQPRAIEYFVLMELCSGGSLMDLITRRNKVKMSEGMIASIFYQIVVAVSHLHSMDPPVAHRDLKIENVLIGSDGEMRLCDFGSCTTRAQVYSTREEMTAEEERIQKYSTSMYRAPEMVDLYKKELINEKVDIWALGCILYTLAFYTQPFQEGGNLQIIGGSYVVPEDHKYSKTLITLIKKQLTLSPKKRPDINKLLVMVKKWIEELKKSGESVNIPTQKKSKKKKQVESSSEDSSSDDSDSDTDSEDESASAKKSKSKKKPPTTNTSFGDDFDADFNANSPSSGFTTTSANSTQGFPSSQSFPQSFPAASQSQSQSNGFGFGFASQPTQPKPTTAKPASPATAFDMNAFADSLIGGPQPVQPPPSYTESQQQAVSPRGVAAGAGSFDFFGGGGAAPAQPSAPSPRGSRTNQNVPQSAQGLAASIKMPKTAPKPSPPVSNGKKTAKKDESSSDDSDSDSDSSSDESSSDSDDDRRKKPAKKAAAKRR